MLEELTVDDLDPLKDELGSLTKRLAKDIKQRETVEGTSKHEDRVLVGMLTSLRALVQKYPASKSELGADLVPHLLKDCLFDIPHRTGDVAGP